MRKLLVLLVAVVIALIGSVKLGLVPLPASISNAMPSILKPSEASNSAPQLDIADRTADTDADGYTDYDEVNVKRFNADVDNFRFNPLISDLPNIAVEVVSAPSIVINWTTTSGESVTQGTETSNTTGSSTTGTMGGTNSSAIENSQTNGFEATIGSEIEAGLTSVSSTITAEFSVNYSATATSSTETTTSWDDSETDSRSDTLSELEAFERSNSISESSGKLSVLARVTNHGDIAFTLDNLSLSAFTLTPFSTDIGTPIENMTVEGGFVAQTLEPGETFGPLVFSADISLGTAKELLANSSGLVIRAPGAELLDVNGQAFAHSMTNVNATTARVIIDYGASPQPGLLPVEDYRVAVAAADQGRMTAGEVMSDILKIDYDVGAGSWRKAADTEVSKTGTGLIGVRGVKMDSKASGYWTVAHTRSTDRGAGSSTDVLNILALDTGYDFDSVVLNAGDVLHMVYISDEDRDGLGRRAELRYGSDPTKQDTDEDGLADILEVNGWDIKSGTVTRRVYSNPRYSDTDGDGISDHEEYLIRDEGSDPANNNGLIAYFPLDNPKDGNVRDVEEVLGGRHGEFSGVSIDGQESLLSARGPIYEAGIVGQSMKLTVARLPADNPFPERGSYVSAPHIPFGADGQPFTITFWVKRSDEDSGQAVALGQDGWIDFSISGAGVAVGDRQGTFDKSARFYNGLGEGWNFVAGVSTGDMLSLYVSQDGKTFPTSEFGVSRTDRVRPSQRIVNPGTGKFVIGHNKLDYQASYLGNLDEVRVYSKALSEDELRQVARQAQR